MKALYLFKEMISKPWRFLKIYIRMYKSFSLEIKMWLLAHIFILTGQTFWGLLLNLWLTHLKFSKTEISSVLSFGNLAIALFALPAVILMSKIKIKNLFLPSHLLASIFFILATFSKDIYFISLFYFLAYAFSIFLKVSTTVFVINYSENSQRTWIFGLHFMITYFSGILGNSIAGVIRESLIFFNLPTILSYQITMSFGIFLSMISFIPFYIILKNKSSKIFKDEKIETFSLNIIKNLPWILFIKKLIPSILISIGAGLVVQFMNLFLKDTFSLSDDKIGFLMSAQAAPAILGGFLTPLIAEKFGKLKSVVMLQLLSVPFMISLAFIPVLWIAAICFILRTALMNMSAPIDESFTSEIFKSHEIAVLSSLRTFTWALSWAFSSWLYGHLMNGRYDLSFLLAAFLYILASLLYHFFFKNVKSRVSSKL